MGAPAWHELKAAASTTWSDSWRHSKCNTRNPKEHVCLSYRVVRKCFLCKPGRPNDAHIVCLGSHLKASLTPMRPTTRLLRHKPNKHQLSFANPQHIKRQPELFKDIQFVVITDRSQPTALTVQLFLLRSPSSLQLQGCPIPLPRCIPPRAPLPHNHARALWYPTLLHSSPSLLPDLPAEPHARRRRTLESL